MPEQNQKKILILDFGAQYSQLIARRVRECHVYSEVKPFSVTLEEIRAFAPGGIIFSGGPGSVYEEGSPHPAKGIYDLGIPILGICYGCQLLAQQFGGEVVPAITGIAREYGKAVTWFDNRCLLFRDIPGESVTWMSHGDLISAVPKGFSASAYSAVCPTACIYDEIRKLYGVQFHPEVTHTGYGKEMIRNFLFQICHCVPDWTMTAFRQKTEKGNTVMDDQRSKIIKTSGEMFFRLGIRSVAIDDICREMGMSKKTFYVYFQSKDELVAQLLQANLDYMESKMKELLDMEDFTQLLKTFLKRQEAEKKDVRRVPQLVFDLKKYYPRQFAQFQHKCFETQKHFIKLYLEQGIEAGLVRANLNIELTAVLFAKLNSDTIRDLEELEAHKINMHLLGHTSMDIFTRGILSEEGLALYNEKA